MQFTRNTSSGKSIFSLIIKLGLIIVLFLGTIFLLSKVDFPAPFSPCNNTHSPGWTVRENLSKTTPMPRRTVTLSNYSIGSAMVERLAEQQ